MNDLIANLQEYPIYLIVGFAIFGYLVGSISTSRLIYKWITKSSNYEPFSESMPFTDEKFDSNLISATWLTKKLGKKYGMLASLGDMIKIAVPTLLIKLIFIAHPYFLVYAIFGICGHNYPIYYKFIGGRGESPIIGAIFVINWFGVFIASFASQIIGFVFGSVLVMRWGYYVLMIFWYWIYFNNIYYVLFMILANFFFWFSMKNDLKKFQKIKKKYGDEITEEVISDFLLMGKSMGRFVDNYGLYHVFKRKLKSKNQKS